MDEHVRQVMTDCIEKDRRRLERLNHDMEKAQRELDAIHAERNQLIDELAALEAHVRVAAAA